MTEQAPLRVCHVVSGDGWGGAEAVLLNLICAQAARNDLEPSLVVLNEGRLAKLASGAGLQVRIVPETGSSLWNLTHALDRVLVELAPAIIHTHRYKEIFFSSILARRHGARNIVTIHGYEPPTAVFDRAKFLLRDTIILRLAQLAGARFVAVSEDLLERFRLSPKQRVIIPNGIPLPNMTPRSVALADPELSRAPVIGWVGRMVPIKGLATLLDAVAQMSSGPQQPRLLLVGDGPERPALESRAQRLGISEHVRFTGFVNDPHPFFACMDLFAFPSLHEGVPLALLEALGTGIPVVAATVGGIPEIIGNSGAARLVASHSPAVWAAAMTELIADPRKARAIGERGRRLVQERFSTEAMVERYIEVYRAVMS
jgi:glycosyltransferase involved in cell wall biosynthesis